MPQLELQREGTTGWGVFQDRYQQDIETEAGIRGETYEEAFERVADFAVVDDPNHPLDKEQQYEIFFDMLKKLKFCPGGRILSNCGGTGNNNPANCFVLPIADSKESIFNQLKNMAFIESYGGGVGMNFSTLRPADSPLKSKNGGYASGPCTFMDVYDAAIHTISQGGSRRGAFIAVLEVWHPDIQKFIHAKEEDETRWTGMNVSVGVTDKFMRAVHADEDWDLTWNGKVVKTVKAKDLWNEICEAAHNSGDPGLLYIDRLNNPDKHPYYYARHIRATNPCVPKHYYMMDAGRLREVCDPRAKDWHSWETGEKKLATVYLANGMRFTCTPDHRILLDDYSFCPAKDLEGKMVMGPNFKDWRGETEIIKNEVIRGIMLDTTDIVHENGESYLDAYLDKDRHTESAKWLYSAGFAFKETKGRNLVLRAPRRKIANLLDDTFLRFPRNNRRIPKDVRFGEASRVRSFLLGFFSTSLKVTTQNMRRSFVLESVNEPRLTQTQLLLSTFGINSKKSETKMSVVQEGLRKKVIPGKTRLSISPGNTTLVKERIGVLNPYHDKGTGGKRVSDCKGIKVEGVTVYRSYTAPVMDFEMHDTQEPYNWVNGLIVHNCGELPLAPYGACCLGSMILPNFVVDGENGTKRFDFDDFSRYVKKAVMFLDNIITNGEFPLEENRKEMDAIRPIGLGFFGLADTFLLLGYKYGSEDSIEFLDEVLGVMKDAALESSAWLASHLGAFPEYNEAKDKVCFSNGEKCPPRRNGSVLSFAPTGSIVLLYGASWGIEPYYAVSMVRNERLGKMNSTYSLLSKWIEDHDGELPEHLSVVKDPDRVVNELTVDDHLNILATVAKWSDNAVSKTVNLPKDATPELSKYVYDKTWQLGVKGCTIYREESKSESAVTAVGSQSSPEDLEFDPEVEEADFDDLEIYDLTSTPRERQLYLDGTTYQLKYSPNSPNLYITINDTGDGPHEVFFVIDDEEKQELLRVVGKLLTSLFRRGHLVTHLINELKGYESATGGGWLEGKYIPSLTAGVGMVLEKHYKRMGYISDVDRVPFITEDEKEKVKGMKGDKCPECNEYTVFPQDGCAVCFNCGHSKCGGVN